MITPPVVNASIYFLFKTIMAWPLNFKWLTLHSYPISSGLYPGFVRRAVLLPYPSSTFTFSVPFPSSADQICSLSVTKIDNIYICSIIITFILFLS